MDLYGLYFLLVFGDAYLIIRVLCLDCLFLYITLYGGFRVAVGFWGRCCQIFIAGLGGDVF